MPTAIASPPPPPPQHQAHPRKPQKRVSLGHSNSNHHPSDQSPLQPSKRNDNVLNSSLPMNDDRAEKASRRKSAHFGELGVAGPGAENVRPGGGAGGSGGGGDKGSKRVVSALAMQGRKGKRLSQVGAAGGEVAQQPQEPVVSLQVMENNFEEWMKMATDNKITATNTWNFALIDYFADLTLLRNEQDQSINFQKASCTLDGCVKIWTSRVDSVATETGKLLSGLAGGGAADEDREPGDDADEDDPADPKPTRKTYHRSEATLAKSFAALQVKKFDLEFTVDPLFKKTCADFDEGGAMGLLMNHLGVDGKGRVVFDAGDTGGDAEEEEEELGEDEMLDLTKLRAFVPKQETLSDMTISDTLASFRFSSDPSAIPDFSTLFGLKDSYDESGPSSRPGSPSSYPAHSHGDGGVHDFFGDEDFDAPAADPFFGSGGGEGDFDDGASVAEGGDGDGNGGDAPSYPGAALGLTRPGEGHMPFDPRRGGEMVMALTGAGGEEGEEGMFDYFDRGLFGKSWAGAEHWKLRKVTRKDPATTTTTSKDKGPKAQKQAFTIDFLSPASASTSAKALFAPAPKASLRLASGKKAGGNKGKKEEHVLPDDMHFSSRQLLRLFLKPKFSLRMRRNAPTARMAENLHGEVDENFWAQAAKDREQDAMDVDGDSAMPAPFESQFFADDPSEAGDYADVDDNLDPSPDVGDVGDEDDLWQGSQGIELKKSRPENVNFAKKAKRVDVKRLKDDIWSGLKTLVPAESSNDDVSAPESDGPATPKKEPEPVKTFDSIITSLRSTYPREKMGEISTSFCFICLLHLANEEGLRLETARFDGKDEEDVGCVGEYVEGGGEEAQQLLEEEEGAGRKKKRRGQDEDGEKRDRVVGELQALRVFKDPNAGRAA